MTTRPTLQVKHSRGYWEPEDLSLVKLIKEHPAIYKFRLPGQKDNNTSRYRKNTRSALEHRHNTWVKIAQLMCTSVFWCKTRWKNIRDQYVRTLKMVEEGKATKGMQEKWMDGTLSFLGSLKETNHRPRKKKVRPKTKIYVPIINEKDTYQSTKKDTCQSTDHDSCIIELEDDDSNPISLNPELVTQDMIESLLQQKSQGCSESITNEADIKDMLPCSSPLINVTEQKDSNMQLEFPRISQIIKINRNIADHDLVTDDMRTAPQSIPIITISGNVLETGKDPESITPNENEDTTEQFFNQMGAFVSSRFTLKKQAEIRMKVVALVTSAELEALEENENIME